VEYYWEFAVSTGGAADDMLGFSFLTHGALKMPKKIATEKAHDESPAKTALNNAIDRIYEKYGTDLGAFYRDVRDDLMKHHKNAHSKQPAS
jgi:hypothetical protein